MKNSISAGNAQIEDTLAPGKQCPPTKNRKGAYQNWKAREIRGSSENEKRSLDTKTLCDNDPRLRLYMKQ